MQTATFAAVAITLYTAHHVGDYWVQTDHQARHKGNAGPEGRRNCLAHVVTYLLTQTAFLIVLSAVTGWQGNPLALWAGLAISGVTHYMADRREHGPMFWLARRLPGKVQFLKLGVPRDININVAASPCTQHTMIKLDNPSLGTGAWALDQSWHIFWGVFVAALVISL